MIFTNFPLQAKPALQPTKMLRTSFSAGTEGCSRKGKVEEIPFSEFSPSSQLLAYCKEARLYLGTMSNECDHPIA